MSPQPSLFGIKNSNRDFLQRETWGKNQFNSSFPASLACYLHSKNLSPVYLKLNADLKVEHSSITVQDLFGLDPLASTTFYSFEAEHTPYLTLVNGNLPRIDLVICKNENGKVDCIRGLEIKLTALPDEQTFNGNEDHYGCEIVVRPDTIVYLALSIADRYRDSSDVLNAIISPAYSAITDWTNHVGMLPHLSAIYSCIDALALNDLSAQKPLLMQPIWKTKGKSPILANDCLDIFVWSDLAFTRLFVDLAKHNGGAKITRHARTAIWLVKMLKDFCETGKIDHKNIIDLLTYDTKNDKAFSIPGNVTQPYMKSDFLLHPRIQKNDIKRIILNGGEKLLSPERRFDSAILSSPEIFS